MALPGCRRQLPAAVYRVETAPPAEPILAKVPGLRRRVEETLIGILETAREMRRLQTTDFDPGSALHLRVRIGDYLISYRLDVGRGVARIAFAERVRPVDPSGNSSSHAA